MNAFRQLLDSTSTKAYLVSLKLNDNSDSLNEYEIFADFWQFWEIILLSRLKIVSFKQQGIKITEAWGFCWYSDLLSHTQTKTYNLLTWSKRLTHPKKILLTPSVMCSQQLFHSINNCWCQKFTLQIENDKERENTQRKITLERVI